MPAGWTETNATCDGASNTPANITIVGGATVTCSFTNTKQATLIVTKTTQGGRGAFTYTGGFRRGSPATPRAADAALGIWPGLRPLLWASVMRTSSRSDFPHSLRSVSVHAMERTARLG